LPSNPAAESTCDCDVLERRSEIGLRRSLGATKGHIRIQFLAEAILLSLGAAGGAAGARRVHKLGYLLG
jgi:putative ABC transport system permease protein